MRITTHFLRIGRTLLVALLVLGTAAPGWTQALAGVTASAAVEADMPSVQDAAPSAGHAHDPSVPDHVHEAMIPGTHRAPGLRIVRALAWQSPGAQPSPGEGTGLKRPPRALSVA